LLEALHVGTQGFSPRTRSDGQLVRFGADAARVALRGTRTPGVPLELELTLRPGEGKRARLNGVGLPSAEGLRAEVATLVFTPDRLAVVKGGPGVRRAYLDRALGRLLPSRATVPTAYATALGQRNIALRRVALGVSSREALAPWTGRVAELGTALVEARREALRFLAPAFTERAGALAFPDGMLLYTGEPPTIDGLEARLERDLERGATGLGPHLDDIGILAGDRDLRLYGSQGEQRLAVLALILAEAAALAERRAVPPLLLLDDVLSELDGDRRAALLASLPPGGQAILSATSAEAMPREPDQLLEVTPGLVTVR